MFNRRLEDFLRRLYLGEDHSISSTGVFRRAMLTGYLSILVFAICIFFIFADLYLGILDGLIIYLTLINFSVIAFLLNRKGKYETAKIVLLFASLLIIFLFSITESRDSGNYFNYFPLAIASFALFGFKEIKKAITFAAITIAVFTISHFYEFDFIPQREFADQASEINFVFHFYVAVVSTMLIILFLIRLNHSIETNLMRKDKYLNITTEKLKSSQQRFELAISGSNAGIYDWDIENDIIYHSPMWKKLLGYQDTELADFTITTFYEFIHLDDVDRVKTVLKDHLQNGSKYFCEFRFRNKEGEYEWFSDSGQALWNEVGDPIRMVGSIIKIHQRKVAEERIKMQNRMLEKTNLELDNFVYSASHDIRSPLTSILGLINIASKTNDADEIQECLKLMKSRIFRLDDFLEDILDFSRNIRTGKKLSEINLLFFIEDILKGNEFGEGFDRMDVKVMIPSDFEVISDPIRLTVIIKNMISNAVRFANAREENPWLRISALSVDENFQLIIEDNGEGIREDLKGKIFDMFYRASEKSKGSGLGLYIVKEMIEKLNGNIKVHSKFGEGSQFIVEIPDHKYYKSREFAQSEKMV